MAIFFSSIAFEFLFTRADELVLSPCLPVSLLSVRQIDLSCLLASVSSRSLLPADLHPYDFQAFSVNLYGAMHLNYGSNKELPSAQKMTRNQLRENTERMKTFPESPRCLSFISSHPAPIKTHYSAVCTFSICWKTSDCECYTSTNNRQNAADLDRIDEVKNANLSPAFGQTNKTLFNLGPNKWLGYSSCVGWIPSGGELEWDQTWQGEAGR